MKKPTMMTITGPTISYKNIHHSVFTTVLPAFICLLFGSPVCGQENIKNYVLTSTVPISGIETDAGMEVIGQAIGDAQVVMLGEQDHGDAPTFLAKTSLIKYLHEKKGFNVLAFESDFFALNEGWDRLEKTGAAIDSFLKKNIFPIWTFCYTCEGLFYNYIPSTYASPNPLMVSGFDNQLYMEYSRLNLGRKLDSMIRALDLPITHKADYVTDILPQISPLRYFATKDSSKYTSTISILKTIKAEASLKLRGDAFWMLVIDNLIAANEEFQLHEIDYRNSGNKRDFQMAENIKWLKRMKYPNQKIIVWAANAHVAKYADSSGHNDGQKVIAMGQWVGSDSSLGKQTYVLGFTSYEGEAGRLGQKKFTVRKPQSNGFETWINPSYEFAYVDFKKYNGRSPGNNEKFYLKGLSHQSAFKANWARIFDGMFFIRHMYSCQR